MARPPKLWGYRAQEAREVHREQRVHRAKEEALPVQVRRLVTAAALPEVLRDRPRPARVRADQAVRVAAAAEISLGWRGYVAAKGEALPLLFFGPKRH